MRLTCVVLLALTACPARAPEEIADDGDAAPDGGSKPRVILLIGDGMGPVHQELASRYLYGAPGALVMEQLPVRGQVLTASPSGITDSAAAATALATGELTYNGRIAIDRDGVEIETVIELARRRGLATGVVTTSTLPHATPAAFSAHELGRGSYRAIAEDQVRQVAPEVMLGGGRRYFEPGDGLDDLFAELAAGGYAVVSDAAELAAIDTATTDRLFGAFSTGHIPYVLDRTADTPGLAAMTTAALEILDRDPDGFFLMIEGARIDHASHANRLADALAETVEFDDAVAAALSFSAERDGVTLIVTADHETGGLDVVSPGGLGELPDVRWRWGGHTNRRVNLHALGPETALLDGALVDHRAVYQIARAAITGEPAAEPPRAALANGHSGELRVRAASQLAVSDTSGRLDQLWVDADRYGLTVGLDGVYSFASAALVVLIDLDFGASTGPGRLTGLRDTFSDPVDQLIGRLAIDGSRIDGFGIDAVAVSIRGIESQLSGGLTAEAGFRLIDAAGRPLAAAGPVVINYDDGVRDQLAAPRSGAEIQIPWSRLSSAGVPAGEIAVVAVLTDEAGQAASNQALPATSTPGVIDAAVVVIPDGDGDGVIDDALATRLEP